MKWKIKNRIIEDGKGEVVGVMSENASTYHEAIIKNAEDMFDAILDYSQSVENTKHPRNPKKHYENFQKILTRITEDAE